MIFHPISLATLQEFNVLLPQMETGCSAGTPNLPHVTEIDPAPHLSDSRLSLLQGSVLLWPLFKSTSTFLIYNVAYKVCLPHSAYLPSGQPWNKQRKGYLILRWQMMAETKTVLPLTSRPKLPTWTCFVRPHKVMNEHLPQSVRIRSVMTCAWYTSSV